MKKALIFFVLISLSGCITKSGAEQKQIIAAYETTAVSKLRTIATAEEIYYAQNGGTYAPLDKLIQLGLMDDPMKGSVRSYRFDVRVKPNGFEATAVPENFGVTGRTSFYIDETHVMRAAEKGGAEATASDPEFFK